MKERKVFLTSYYEQISNYQSQIEDFYKDIYDIRKAFGLPQYRTGLYCPSNYHYTKYLGDNEYIVKMLKAQTSHKDKEYMVVADTGSGKTYLFFNLTNKDEWNIGLFPYWSITDHNSNKYTVERIVGGDHPDFSIETVEIIDNCWVVGNKREIVSNKRFASLYDTADKLQTYFEELEINGVDLKKEKGLVWVDEAHLIVDSTFRPEAIKKVLKFIKFIRERTGLTIMYTTATPFNCHLLPITDIEFFDKEEEKSNIKEVSEYICESNQKINDMIITHIKKALNNDKKVILRVNNINFIKNLEQQFPNVEVITGENKGESRIFKRISEESTLDMSDTNILALTCVLDAGVSIDKVEGCDVSDIENIFIIDKNIDMNELKQFSNRLRFETSLTLLVDKHDAPDEEVHKIKTFKETVDEFGTKYGEYWKNFQKLNEAYSFLYKDEKQRREELQRVLMQRNTLGERNSFGSIFYIEDNEIKYNYYLAYKTVWEIYQHQFFYHDDLRREFLKDTFLVDDIKTEEIEYNDEFVDVIDEKVEDFLNKVKNDEDLQLAIKINDTKEIKKVLYDKYEIGDSCLIFESKKYEKFMELTKYEKPGEAATSILEETPIEIGKKIKEYQRKELENLKDNEIKEISNYIKNRNIEEVKSQMALRVIRGDYFQVYEDAFSINVGIKDIQEIIKKDGVQKAKLYLREETVIKFNKELGKVNWKGQAQYQQYALIHVVENFRTKKTVCVNDEVLKSITRMMGKRTKTKWQLKDIKEFIKLVYSCSETKDGLVLYGLRKQHSH